MVAPSFAGAQPLLPPGHLALRHDLEVLADAGIIRVPTGTWPLSWPDIAREVNRIDEDEAARSGHAAALSRVRSAAKRAARNGSSEVEARVSGSHQPDTLRSFEQLPREEGEVQAGLSWLGARAAMNLSVTAVSDPDDRKRVRLDGSYVGVTIGNWIVTAGAVDRWWGHGWDGSLILSTNARPIPSVAIERNYSDAPGWRLLRWVGPWRASVSMGALEGRGVSVTDARLFAARIDLRPQQWLQLGLSRTAQWCGTNRPCDLGAFGDLLLGRDNRDPSEPAEREPGNQLAGYDLRLSSPWRGLPVAAYLQLIGEDEAGGLPSKFLGLMGAESWGYSRLGSHRIHAEYADTSCNFAREHPQFDCAYRSGLYPQGYTFRGRAIGHALDGDGRMYSIGALLVRPRGASWSLRARRIELNRAGEQPESAHSVSASQDELKDLQLQYNRAFARGELSVGMGLVDYSGPLRSGSEQRGFVQWRQGF